MLRISRKHGRHTLQRSPLEFLVAKSTKPALPSLPWGTGTLNKSRRLSQTLQNATRTWTRQNHPASPNMSSLSISHLLLLLLALHAPQAKGLPVMTSRAPYSMLMREIMDDLKKITPSPEVSSWDKVGKGQGRAGRCLGPIGCLPVLHICSCPLENARESIVREATESMCALCS